MNIDETARKDEIARNLEWEQKILVDVEARTGVRLRSLSLLDLAKEAASHQIVPILVEWLDRGIPRGDVRGALYLALGKYPRVKHLLPHLLRWWANEDDQLSLSSIASILTHSVSASSGRVIWEVVKTREWSNAFADLYVKLARIPALRHEVIPAVVQILKTQSVSIGAMERLGRISDPEVQRSIAQRSGVVEGQYLQRPRRPQWLQIAKEDHSTDPLIFHGEVETSEINSKLQTIAAELGVQFPDFAGAIPFLASLPPSWFKRVIELGSRSFTVYLRAEDVDVVELAVFLNEN